MKKTKSEHQARNTFYFTMIFMIVSDLINEYPAEKAVKRWISKDDQFYSINIIGDDKAVAFVSTNCTGLIRLGCDYGRYYILLNKENGNWAVNESSKRVVWD